METANQIGGNKFLLSLGHRLSRWGKRLIDKGSVTIISNPSCKFINPFTLLVNFTVNGNKKYQLVIQGHYKDKYKEFQDTDNPISEDEMFIIIRSHVNTWFLKE